jgi:hypothetical protein
VKLENGMIVQLKVAITLEGALVVTGTASEGAIDVRKAVLVGTQVARDALHLDPKTITSALFQTI